MHHDISLLIHVRSLANIIISRRTKDLGWVLWEALWETAHQMDIQNI